MPHPSNPSHMKTPPNGSRRGFGLGSALAIISVLVTAVCVTCTFAVRWLLDTWGQIQADEIVYHLRASLEGTNVDMVRDALVGYALPALLCVIALVVLLVLLRGRRRAQALVACGALAVSAAFASTSIVELERSCGLVSYLTSPHEASDEDFIAQNYVDPSQVGLTFPAARRNLVYIFLESVEMTYADVENGGAFDVNVIPELTELAREGEDFSGDSGLINGAAPLPGTGWTMGGMFAQSTGLPLKVPFDGNAMESQDAFFPGVTSLGDLLAAQGYRQILLLGSDATFGGRRLFYSDHGQFEIHDYPYAQETGLIPEDYKVFWGYEDERLFAFARDELVTLSQGDRPFNLTLLTVDTHFEDGYVCRLCGDEFGSDQYANVMACSSRQVYDFVRWMQQQDFYEDTTIVICGDHRTMDKDFVSWVDDSYLRRTFTVVINGAATPSDPSRERRYSTFDLFPTTLAALGVEIDGERLGLGTNLYSDEDTLLEHYGDSCRKMLSGPSEFLATLGSFSFGEDVLPGLTADCKLRAELGEDGRVLLVMSDASLQIRYVTGAAVEVTDDRTGETRRFEMEVLPSDSSPEYFWCRVETDYTEEDLEHLSCVGLLSTEDCEDFPACTELSED